MRQPSAVEIKGIQAIIKEWSGLDINLVQGGPSMADPCGEIAGYISFRNDHGDSCYLTFARTGKITKSLGDSSGAS